MELKEKKILNRFRGRKRGRGRERSQMEKEDW